MFQEDDLLSLRGLPLLGSAQLEELFDGKPSLIDNRFKGSTLEVSIVERNGNPKCGVVWMLKDVMAS